MATPSLPRGTASTGDLGPGPTSGGAEGTNDPQAAGSGGQHGAAQARVGGELEDALTGPQRLALQDYTQAANACRWCADQCVAEGEVACARLCRDVAEIAEQASRLVSRNSPIATDVGEVFARVAEECARECARHPHDHCRACERALRRAVDSTWTMLDDSGR